MTDTLLSFMLFWGIWLLVPLSIDGTTALAYLFSVWQSERHKLRQRLEAKQPYFPLVSILIPVHNGSPYLRKCIESIRKQSYPLEKIEVFVVDNLSDDGSYEVFKEEQEKPFRGSLRWVSVPVRGKSYALNAGIHVAQGEYITNIDCDIRLHPDAIMNMIKAFTADPELAAATGSVEVLPYDGDGSDTFKRVLAECEFLEYFTSFRIGRQYQSNSNSLFTLAGAFSIFRRDVLLRTFLYDKQTVSEDTKITFDLHKAFSKRKKKCLAEAVVYTEPTPTLAAFFSQRVRWQRGQLEVASLYPEFIHTPFHRRGLASSRSLVVDHTLAFARAVWTFLLPMLYFLGYSMGMVFTANVVMYVCYIGVEMAYFTTSYMLADDAVRKRLRQNWWLIGVMPMYRFTLFWFRFGGFLTVLTDPAEWKTKDPITEVREALAQLRQDLVHWRQGLGHWRRRESKG